MHKSGYFRFWQGSVKFSRRGFIIVYVVLFVGGKSNCFWSANQNLKVQNSPLSRALTPLFGRVSQFVELQVSS